MTFRILFQTLRPSRTATESDAYNNHKHFLKSEMPHEQIVQVVKSQLINQSPRILGRLISVAIAGRVRVQF